MLFFMKPIFFFYKDKIDTKLDKLDPFKFMLFLPSIFDNDIVVPTPVSDIVPSILKLHYHLTHSSSISELHRVYPSESLLNLLCGLLSDHP